MVKQQKRERMERCLVFHRILFEARRRTSRMISDDDRRDERAKVERIEQGKQRSLTYPGMALDRPVRTVRYFCWSVARSDSDSDSPHGYPNIGYTLGSSLWFDRDRIHHCGPNTTEQNRTDFCPHHNWRDNGLNRSDARSEEKHVRSSYICSSTADVRHISLVYRVNRCVFVHQRNTDRNMFERLMNPKNTHNNGNNLWDRQDGPLHSSVYICFYLAKRRPAAIGKRSTRSRTLTLNILGMITTLTFRIIL